MYVNLLNESEYILYSALSTYLKLHSSNDDIQHSVTRVYAHDKFENFQILFDTDITEQIRRSIKTTFSDQKTLQAIRSKK
jgi:hypothetical protein